MHASSPIGRNIVTTLSSKVPWTVRSEAQSTWTVRQKSTTCLIRVNFWRHQRKYGPISAWCVPVGAMWTTQVITCVKFGMLSRYFINGTNQSAFDMWHMAEEYMPRINGSFQKLRPKIDVSRPIKIQFTWTVRSKSDFDTRLPPCYVSDGSLEKLHQPIRAWHVAYGVTRGMWHSI
jgi:hypothetical protein